jgi:signal transduction histidine kinase
LIPPGEDPADVAPASTLEQVVLSAVTGFGHLPLEIRTALGRTIRINPLDATILRSAIISLLYNVQFHARAREVVVHTDCDASVWEVSICDDGIGFDPESTHFGFGLQNQVLDATRRAGMSVEIVSRPGEGTCVYIRGKVRVTDDN